MKVTLDWLGTATFRLTIGETVVFLDAYMDRVPSAPPGGLSTSEVTKADFVLVGHAHFDHIAGAEVIAANTGAKIIGSPESCRVMRERGVPEGQLLQSHGGERHRPAPGVTAWVVPSLHACTWVYTAAGTGENETGATGLTQDERMSLRGLPAAIGEAARADSDEARAIVQHIRGAAGSRDDGGALGYLIETPAGSIYWHDSSGCWTGVLRTLHADVAILAASGRANVDGEPIQGSLAQFIAMEAEILGAKTVVLGHHDNWMPPVTRPGGLDVAPIREELQRRLPNARFLEPGYLDGTVLLEA
jgi:L-ascorbate metabolism protein UlaG (beta-lactamase superfamily)